MNFRHRRCWIIVNESLKRHSSADKVCNNVTRKIGKNTREFYGGIATFLPELEEICFYSLHFLLALLRTVPLDWNRCTSTFPLIKLFVFVHAFITSLYLQYNTSKYHQLLFLVPSLSFSLSFLSFVGNSMSVLPPSESIEVKLKKSVFYFLYHQTTM